jgi:hypothetical protein
MGDDKSRLINLFERKINLLLENNAGYSRFKYDNPAKQIKKIISQKITKKEIIDLGYLMHLQALNFRLTMYRLLTPFDILNFKKDLQDVINVLHAYKRQRNPQLRPVIELLNTKQNYKQETCLLEIYDPLKLSADNPKLHKEIIHMFEGDAEKMDL